MFRRTLIAAAFVSAGVSAPQANARAAEKSPAQFSALFKPSSSLAHSASLDPAALPQRTLVPALPVALGTPSVPPAVKAPQPEMTAPVAPTVTTISPARVLPGKPAVKLTRNFSTAPGASAPAVPVKGAIFEAETKGPTAAPPVEATPAAQPAAPTVAALPRQTPARLASREARARELMLARLDADLLTAEKRLNRAESRLSAGQRSLQSVVGVLQSAMLEAGGDARGLHPFVRVAQRYLGTPYVWGGESARGFDCSGFIMRVMRDLGYRALPHSAAEQFRYGTPIARELLQPGDLVFFANTYKPGISHVGIYLGRGRFIHAANSKDGTIISNINTPKWVEKYAGARRLVKG